jgi:hypothetical protein
MGGFDMRHSTRRQLLGLSLTFSTVLAAAGGATIANASAGQASTASSAMVATARPGLRPGDRVSLDGVSVLVPRPGRGAWGATVKVGGSRVLGVQTGADGSVTVYRQGVLTGHGAGGSPGSVRGAAKPLSACSDAGYSLTGASWSTRVDWYFKTSSTPGEITQSDALSALRNAMRNLTQVNNDCGLKDAVSANSLYMGGTIRSANIGTGSTCSGSDGMNVVDFGNLAATDLGYACWWTWGRSTTESDMRLNSSEYSWAVNLGGCVGKYSVEDVATHELGHTFGLNDLSEKLHPALTMSLVMLPCQNAETTLGLGDVRGLKALY